MYTALRIRSTEVEEKLREEVHQKDISKNKLINQILEKHYAIDYRKPKPGVQHQEANLESDGEI